MIKTLVVDDDADLLDMVTFMLQANEIEVVPLLDCRQFFETVQSAAPDIIVLDVYLGYCDGRDLCNELKTRAAFSRIPVILYSAAAEISKDILDVECARHFMRKPFEMDVLINRIRHLAA